MSRAEVLAFNAGWNFLVAVLLAVATDGGDAIADPVRRLWAAQLAVGVCVVALVQTVAAVVVARRELTSPGRVTDARQRFNEEREALRAAHRAHEAHGLEQDPGCPLCRLWHVQTPGPGTDE